MAEKGHTVFLIEIRLGALNLKRNYSSMCSQEIRATKKAFFFLTFFFFYQFTLVTKYWRNAGGRRNSVLKVLTAYQEVPSLGPDSAGSLKQGPSHPQVIRFNHVLS